MENEMLLNLALLFGVLVFLVIYRFLRKGNRKDSGYMNLYKKVINSEEYKVKKQWE